MCVTVAQPNCTRPNPGGATVVTNSTTSTFINVDTPVTQRIDQFSTTVLATLNGGQTVFQQTFALPFGNPAVQAAILMADSILTADHANFGAPVLASTSNTFVGSQFAFVKTGQVADGNTVATTASTFGPAIVNVGDNQTETFYILSGQLDINVNVNIEFNVLRNALTTNTFLTTQTYSINGATSPAATPEPASWPMLIVGLGALAGLHRLPRRQ